MRCLSTRLWLNNTGIINQTAWRWSHSGPAADLPMNEQKILYEDLIVALPHRPLIFVCRVPGLRTEEPAAVFADKPCSEYAVSAVPPAEGFSPCHLKLHQFPIFRRDNGIVGMLDVVLWNFAVVFLHLVLKEIYREFLLVTVDNNDTVSNGFNQRMKP